MNARDFDDIDETVETAVECAKAALAKSESMEQGASDGVNGGEVLMRPKNRHVLQVSKLAVQHVTVYLDRAEVARRATHIYLNAGINEIRCTQLSPAIEKETLRADVRNTQDPLVITSINDVAYLTRHLADEESEYQRSLRELQDALDGFYQQRETVVSKLSRLEKQRSVLDSFADCFLQNAKNRTPMECNGVNANEKPVAPSEKVTEKEKSLDKRSDKTATDSGNSTLPAASWPFDSLGVRLQNGTGGCNGLNGMPLGLAAGAVGAAKVVECMSGFFDLFDKQAALLDTGLQQARRQLEKVDTDIRAHQTKLKELSFSRDERQERELLLIVEASAAVVVDLNLSYVVNRAKWTPRYDVRVYAAESLMKLFYYGVVQQSTGEDWLDAPLTLCTAQPAIGGAVPELLIQKVGFKSKSTPDTPYRANSSRKSTRKPVRSLSVSQSQYSSASMYVSANGQQRVSNRVGDDQERSSRTSMNAQPANPRHSGPLDDVSVSAFRDNLTDADNDVLSPLASSRPGQLDSVFEDEYEPSGRDHGGNLPVSSTFAVARTYSIMCNATPVKVMIALVDMSATLDYETNPRRAPAAFVRASAKNVSSYVLLAGPSNVYLNNQFVSRSEMRTVLPQEQFVAHLGADPAVRIGYRPLLRSREGGIAGKTSSIVHRQVIDVKNGYEKPIRIRVADQVPLSCEERIKVTILEPTIKHPERYDRSKPIRLHPRTNIVEWDLEVAPREAKELVLRYVVEYPANEDVEYVAEL